jgi:hypothetical protein
MARRPQGQRRNAAHNSQGFAMNMGRLLSKRAQYLAHDIRLDGYGINLRPDNGAA